MNFKPIKLYCLKLENNLKQFTAFILTAKVYPWFELFNASLVYLFKHA